MAALQQNWECCLICCSPRVVKHQVIPIRPPDLSLSCRFLLSLPMV